MKDCTSRAQLLMASAHGLLTMIGGVDAAYAAAAKEGITLQTFIERRSAQIFRTADTDVDKRISEAEFVAVGNAAQKGRREQRFMRFDLNRDGYLDAPEVGAIFEKRFASRDRNGDGRLTHDERVAFNKRQADRPKFR